MKHHPDYELFEELGRGQSTVVYRGHDLTLGRDVAIKTLDESLGQQNPHREAQFIKEAKFLAQFEHENILRVYSVDTSRHWIIMEMMQATLASQIVNQNLSPDLVRSVLRQTLRALDFLHRKQKVHAAVRPSNLLINDEGFVKLSDFEETDSEGELRIPTASKKYLAPELFRTDFGDFGPALDFYNLGFTALELLLGPKFDSLFPGTGEGAIDADMAWMRWHNSDETLPPCKSLSDDIPDDVATIIDRLLVKQVDQRPQSAREIIAMLEDRPLIRVEVKNLEEQQPERTPFVASVREVGERTVKPKKTANAPPTEQTEKKKTTGARNWRDVKVLTTWVRRPVVFVPLCSSLVAGMFLASMFWPVETPVVANTPPPSPTKIVIDEKPVEVAPITELVALLISPSTASVQINTKPYGLEDGLLEIDLAEDQELTIDVSQDGYFSYAETIPWQELVDSQFTLSIDLEREEVEPSLPPSLTAKVGAAVDPETNLPERAISTVLVDDQPLEFLLVKPSVARVGAEQKDRFAWELPSTEFELRQPFYIAVTEITIAQYAQFDQSEGAESAGESWLLPAQEWISRFDKSNTRSSLPATNMSVQQARSFCRWIGGRLPSENEWEMAVRRHSLVESRQVEQSSWHLFRGYDLQPRSALTEGSEESKLINSLGNAAEWCSANGQNQFLVKGCSFATPIGNHVRASWRSKASLKGEWDIGIRVIIPIEVPEK